MLPPDILRLILIPLDHKDLFNFSLINRYTNEYVLNERFWQIKYFDEYGRPEKFDKRGWQYMYQNYVGEVWICGYNQYGQLGLNDNLHRYIPTELNFQAKAVSAGSFYTVFIQ